MFARLLDAAMTPVLEWWRDARLGFYLPGLDTYITHIIWADNLYILSDTQEKFAGQEKDAPEARQKRARRPVFFLCVDVCRLPVKQKITYRLLVTNKRYSPLHFEAPPQHLNMPPQHFEYATAAL